MQSYSQIADSARVSDSLAPLLANDQTAISRNAGTAFPTSGLVVGMPYFAITENKLYRLTSLAPITWVVELDYNKTLASTDDVAVVATNANSRVARAGDTMTGYLTLNGDPTQSLHATPKRYVDTQMAAAVASAGTRLLRAGDTMTGLLTLSGDPTAAYHAVTKNYADYLYNALNSAKMGRSGDTLNDVYNNGWFRSNGATGWFNQTYAGGLYMNDTVAVKVYNGKGFYTDAVQLQTTGAIYTSRYGYLENYFALKAAEDRINGTATIDAGSGGVIAPASFYLDRSGTAVRLVRVSGNCNCNCACTCFPAGTRIMMGDRSWKVVEDIKVGDVLMTPLGPEAVLDVETPVLGDRRMIAFDDLSLIWTDDHGLWTRRDGKQAFGVYDKNSWMRGVEQGVVAGLPNNDDVRLLNDQRDQFAHISGWVERRTVVASKRQYPADTPVYLPIVGGCHMIIAEGYVVSAGANGFDFDYDTFNWEGFDEARA